nr:HAMP domain-containing sensor histidine kinase [uncultured Pseudomonas sp.]
MNESKGTDAREDRDEAHKLAFTDPRKKRQVLAHLAALQRELLEAETVAGNGVHIQLLVEANQRLVRAALAVPDLPLVQEPATLKSLQQEMQEANEHLVLAALRAQKLQADAEHALSRQRNALTSVVHEMRNPLTPISLLAQRMRMTPSCDVPQMGVLIENQVKHLSRMIEDLLDISRVSRGKLSLNCTPVDIIPILQEAVDSCASLILSKTLTFDVSLPATEVMVNGDRVRIMQIFTNIITNAAKYTPRNGMIALICTPAEKTLAVVVSDNGIGIPSSLLPRIFDPYVQDVEATGFDGSGLGIGLTVVRELVDAHGALITAQSDGPGRGSQFTVTFPIINR